MATKFLTLDAWQPTMQGACAFQGEADARFLDVALVSSGQPVDLTGRTVYLYLTKPDGREIFNACTVTDAAGGRASVALTAQMSAAAGQAKNVEFRIVGGAEDTETLKIRGPQLYFFPSDYDGAVASTDEYTALTQALADVNNFETVKALAEGAIPSSQKGAANGVAALDSAGKLAQMPSAADVGAIPASEKGEAGGVAALNASGKLAQMPSAADVGAIPSAQKGAAGGVAALNASGKLAQMPTPADIGEDDYVTETGSNANGYYMKYASGRMICWVRQAIAEPEWTTWGETGLKYASHSWTYPVPFASAPIVSLGMNTNSYVWVCIGTVNTTIGQARLVTPTASSPTGFNLHGIALGSWK